MCRESELQWKLPSGLQVFLGVFCDTVSAAREGEFRFVLKQTYGYWSVSGPCIELEGFFFSANIDVSPAQSPESWKIIYLHIISNS